MKVRLDEVTLDEDIYPRLVERGGKLTPRISGKTIESYVEAIKGGAVFPPIEVQRIRIHLEEKGETIEKLICLDGWHRILAYKEYNKWVETEKREKGEKNVRLEKITEVEAIPWKDWTENKENILNKKEHLEELRIESARRKLIHGNRLASSDLKFQALRIVRERPIERLNGIVTELAETFQRSVSYMSELIGEEVRRRRMTRDAQIFRISLLGWTQEEIGELFGLTQRQISNIRNKFATEVSSIQDRFYKKHKSVEEIATFYNLDDITTWAIVLEGKDDLERFKLFGRPEYQDDSPRLYNVWNFPQRDPRLGRPYPGNIPGQIAMNVLYYYTKQGDLVVDPMAGGGSTIDACLIMNRKCRAYDIRSEWEVGGVKYSRKDIIIRDLWEGFDERAKGCDLIFLDPPYWRLEREFYVEESISANPVDDWRKFMKKVAMDSYLTLKDGGHVALVIEAFLDELVTCEFLDLPFECVGWFKDVGFKEVYRISIPMPSQIKSDLDVVRYKKKKIMLDLNRDLIIFKKV